MTKRRMDHMQALVALVPLAVIFLTGGCSPASRPLSNRDEALFARAEANGVAAREGFVRINRYMNDWLAFADPYSKLVPRNMGRDKDIWNANDCAADNFPFLVLTAFFTDTAKLHGILRTMLENEIRLTSRVKSLPDTWSFSKKDFRYEEVSMPRIVFGTTEYIKDGLVPVTEWMGESPWSDRMLTMLRDLDGFIDVAGGFGEESFGSAPDAEVNGELLQALSRIYWFTGDRRFLEWAVQIGDHFLLGKGYPLASDYLRLRDHGCEVVSGLCELYVTLHFADTAKQHAYRKPLYTLLDRVLEYGRNADGLFYNAINPRTGEAVAPDLADSWGYTLNGFYAVYMVDSVAAYREAVTRVFSNLHRYRNYNWENHGADGFADAIEGALNLYNRIPDDSAASWIDSETRVMWSMQDSAHRANAQRWKGSGIIEGWYGDGNFARTTILYNLWKSKGTYLRPWNDDVLLGGEMKGDTLCLVVKSAAGWKGKLHFDVPRHAAQLKLPLDWPRINQFPEWFTVRDDEVYRMVDVHSDDATVVPGKALKDGVPLLLQPGETRRFMLTKQR